MEGEGFGFYVMTLVICVLYTDLWCIVSTAVL